MGRVEGERVGEKGNMGKMYSSIKKQMSLGEMVGTSTHLESRIVNRGIASVILAGRHICRGILLAANFDV